ncbi:MAG: hypothetical protein U0793_05700 [Gemmataceae bacterium]
MSRATVRCPHCEKRFRPESTNDKRIACPHCAGAFRIASPADDAETDNGNAAKKRKPKQRKKEQSKLVLYASLGGALLVLVFVLLIFLLRNSAETPAPVAKGPATPPALPERKEPPPFKAEAVAEARKEPPAPEVRVPAKETPTPAPRIKIPDFVVAPPTPEIAGVNVETIALALDKGVAFLKAMQLPSGAWPCKEHEVGYAALAGLALLECGALPNDPAIVRAATFIRPRLALLEYTYDLSLAVLFLDRLEQPGDRALIQGLALRIAAGQTEKGGWDYKCPILSPPQMGTLLTFLQSNRPRTVFQVAVRDDLTKFVGQAKNQETTSSPGEKTRRAEQQGGLSRDEFGIEYGEAVTSSGSDSSAAKEKVDLFAVSESKDAEATFWKLTTFKKEAWMAERGTGKEASPPPRPPLVRAKPRKDAPGERKGATTRPRLDILPIALRDFPVVGGTGKSLKKERDDNSNTQFALLALWAARRHDLGGERSLQFAGWRFRVSQNADGGWGYQPAKETSPPMTCVGMLGLAMSIATAPELPKLKKRDAAGRLVLDDAQLLAGLKKASDFIGAPAAKLDDVRWQSAYYLWSVERMAMLYGLAQIGGRDWYGWGAQILLKHQGADGAWSGGGYPGSDAILDTCFGLLFLRRSNLAHEFTDALQKNVALPEP